MAARRLHPFDVASRVLADRLHGLEASADLRAALAGDEIDWTGVVGLTSEQFVLAALAAAVRDLGLAGTLEPELRDFLAAVHAANVERNQRLRAQLAEVVACLNQIGVEPVLLKGAIRLVDDLFPDPGWRMMWDLDLLVPQDRLAHAVAALGKEGYAASARALEIKPRGLDHYHYAALSRSDCRAVVEVHREVFALPRQQRLLLAAETLAASTPVTFDGVTVRLPSVEHQMTHLIGHCQMLHQGYAFGRVALRDRLEAAALMRRACDGVAWPQVVGRFVAAGYRRPLLTFLLALQDGGWGAAPDGVVRPDALARLQASRVAHQARSESATWVSRRVVHGAALLHGLMVGRGSRRALLGLLVGKARHRTREMLAFRNDRSGT